MFVLSVLLRLVSEVPVLEDTLYRVLTMGLSRDLHLSAADLIELVDIIVRRAAAIHTDGELVMVDIIVRLAAVSHTNGELVMVDIIDRCAASIHTLISLLDVLLLVIPMMS